MKIILLLLFLCIDPLDMYAQQQPKKKTNRQQTTSQNKKTPQKRQAASQSKKTPNKQQANKNQQTNKISLSTKNFSLTNLVLLESNYDQWVTFLQFPEENRLKYSAIYYNPANYTYFHATIQETNRNISSVSDFSSQNKKNEKTFDPSFFERFLLYISDLPENKRLFTLHTNTNKFYIKSFNPILDQTYFDNDSISTNTEMVYPVLNTLYKVQYTNKSDQIFNRILTGGGQLRFLGSVNTSLLLPLSY
ncbi:MAG: hypothetical protein ACRCWI_07630 [Brevinema sp.]